MNKINEFLKDISYNTKYTFLNMASDSDELTEIAEKKGIRVPSKDLAIFKGIYGFVDRVNHNHCSLPKAEVAKALDTLVGKAVDFDHLRKRVVGHWIDAKIVGDEIICYGVFFKGNFDKDYEMIQELMEGECLGISFEAWGTRDFKDDGTYDLLDIEFAGGALLPTSEPAFDGAGVLTMANKNRVLEFASKLQTPKEFLHATKEKEVAQFDVWDFETILRIVNESELPAGVDEDNWREIESVDFKNAKVAIRYEPSGIKAMVDLKPTVIVSEKAFTFDEFDDFDKMEEAFTKRVEYLGFTETKLTTEERKAISDKDFALIKKIRVKSGKEKKIRMFPLHDQAHVRNALSRLEQSAVQETLKKLGVSIDTVERKILTKAKEFNMKEILKKYEVATAEEQATLYEEAMKQKALLTAEIEALKKAADEKEAELEKKAADDEAKAEEVKADEEKKEEETASLKAQLEAAQKEAEEAKAEIAKRDAEIIEAKVAERKEALGDFVGEMTDEELLDDLKYENATLKKENASLKDTKGEEAPAEEEAEGDLSKGSKDKKTEDVVFQTRNRVMERAYGKSE